MSRLPFLLKGMILPTVSLALLTSSALAQTFSQLKTHAGPLPARTLSQIAALEREADSRTPAQLKISSQLVYALKTARGEQIVPGIHALRTLTTTDSAGRTLVDIDTDVTPDLLYAITRAGGVVINTSERWGAVRASVPLSSLETLASLPGVRWIKPAVIGQPQNPAPLKRSARTDFLSPYVLPVPERLSLPQREDVVRTHLPALLARIGADVGPANPAVGSVVDEADKTHQADKARSTFGVDGTGIKVGVLSDSIDDGHGAYADAVASGDVSSVTVISGQAGTGEGEGLAMEEAVHHLAPGAKLYFATAEGGDAKFADNIIALQQAGCKVIVDDFWIGDDSPFQDSVISKAINTVTAAGTMYFSCAANFGNVDDGTASVWEGDFKDSGDTAFGDGNVHTFASSQGLSGETNEVQTGSQQAIGVELFWSDPLGKSSNDYDLFVVDSGLNVVSSSTDRQTGSQDPFEEAGTLSGDFVVIVKHSGSTRYLHLNLGAQNSILNYVTNQRVAGHNSTANAFCVAATPAAKNQNGQSQGPYPSPFNSSDVVETFSDDGGRRYFYNPDGSAITSGNFTHTGGRLLAKPDFTAADGTSSTLPSNSGLNPFFGTSCATPHAGAIAALILSYNPTLTRAQLATILDNSATDIMASGDDRDAGFGILNAYKALQNTSAPSATPTISSLSPSSATAGSGSFTLTVTGAHFVSGSIVKWNDATQTTTFVSSTKLTASISASLIASAGTATVTVTTPHVGTSGSKTFTINASAAPPTISSISPSSATAGGSAFTLTVNGAHFISGSIVKWNGATETTTFVSSAKLTTSIPASLIASAGTATVTVTTPHVGTSVGKTFTINASTASAPVLSSISPTTRTAGGGQFVLTANGSHFVSGSIIKWNGATQTTTFVSSTKLTATIPASLIASAGMATVTVTTPHVGTSGSKTLTINPASGSATLTKLSFNPNPTFSNGTSTGTVTLSAAAPSGGADVDISNGGTSILTATIAAGKTSTTFVLTVPAVTSTTSFTIDAKYNGKTVSAVLKVNTTSVKPSKLSFSPSTVNANINTTGTVALTAAAPAGGAVVTITQDGTSLGSILVPAGSTSTTFTYAPADVSDTTTYTMGAVYNGKTVTANLTVKPATKS